jgi:hypothetical protein
LTLTLPSHLTDDILVCLVEVWVPNTPGDAADIPALTGWTKVKGYADADGELSLFWRRATSNSTANPTFTRGTSWDTGTDGIFAGRAFVIRGCVTTGDPWDDIVHSATPESGPNTAFPAVTVSGSERTVVIFFENLDNSSAGAAPSGWTEGTATTSATGTDSGFQTFRKDNVSSSTSADASNVAASNIGFLFWGISFKPPAGAPEQFLSSALDISPTIATAVTREAFIAAALDVSPSIATALTREAFIASTLDIAPAISVALIREAFLSTAADISPAITTSLTREQFLAVTEAIGLTISTSIAATSEQLLSASLDVSPAVSTALLREQFIAASLQIALTIEDTITREAFLATALDISPHIDTSITGGTGVSLSNLMTLGVG